MTKNSIIIWFGLTLIVSGLILFFAASGIKDPFPYFILLPFLVILAGFYIGVYIHAIVRHEKDLKTYRERYGSTFNGGSEKALLGLQKRFDVKVKKAVDNIVDETKVDGRNHGNGRVAYRSEHIVEQINLKKGQSRNPGQPSHES